MSIPSSTPTRPQPTSVSRAVSSDGHQQFKASIVTWLVISVSFAMVVLSAWFSFVG